ncbi:ectoine synthase [Anabaena sp. UHCC 0187]|uniref:ectoine synthase n=1 Tax=Anabaena sp. UHCC 0187 TaxID=2590018 RepID=UPI001448375C|nr:ectoine synthase [Anabaena sp. UHCC 0187]MTJ13730.1 ectoine synthase [Anabaena sp. UHCC 0187]
MIIRTLEQLIETDRDVAWGNGQSRRFLTESDGMGYSLTDTIINTGTESLLQYTNHFETCYCIQGEGEIEATDGTVYPIKVGTMYALDQHDKHYLRAKTTMRLVCVFYPALKGNESHNLTSNHESSYS